MDDFKDFFKELRERVSNPFISSFIISWLFSNWPITIAVLFYDLKEVNADGFRSHYQLINYHSGWIHSLILPIAIATMYTYCFPYIKSAIKLHNATIKSKNESDILLGTQDQSVSLKKYIEMLNENKATQTKLSSIITEQSVIFEENAQLLANLNEETLKYNQQIETNNKLMSANAAMANKSIINILKGTWVGKKSGSSLHQIWSFDESKLIINDIESFSVQNFISDPFSRNVTFKLVPIKNGVISPENYFLLYFRTDDTFTYLIPDRTNKSSMQYELKRKIEILEISAN